MISLFFKSTISKKNDILIPFRVDRMIQLLLMYFKYVLEKFYSHTKSSLSWFILNLSWIYRNSILWILIQFLKKGKEFTIAWILNQWENCNLYNETF